MKTIIISKFFKKVKLIPLKIMNYFYYTGRPKYLNPIYYFRKINEQKSIKKLKNVDSGDLYKLIMNLINRSGSTGCEFSDYYELYKQLNIYKPKMILECGSGISSLVIAYFISKRNNKEKYKCVSCEENANYSNEITNIFPSGYMKFIDFVHLERKEGNVNGIPCSYYEDIPENNYDYIFIDGPTFRKNNQSQKCFNSDLINIIKKDKNIIVNGIIDQRLLNYIVFKKLMPNANVKYDVVKKLTYLKMISGRDLKV